MKLNPDRVALMICIRELKRADRWRLRKRNTAAIERLKVIFDTLPATRTDDEQA